MNVDVISTMKKTVSIVWFRQDLRLHDNEALNDALDSSDEVIPVYVFDERLFYGDTPRFGFRKTGVHRARFIIEAVNDLRKNLRQKGTDLVVRVGKPEEEIAKLARDQRVRWVFCNRERTREEVEVQDALEENLWTTGQELRYSRGKMLFHTADLPFPITQTPDIFTQFRKEVEKIVPIRQPLETSAFEGRNFDSNIVVGDIPSLEDLDYKPVDFDLRDDNRFVGGERSGKERLEHYFWKTQSLSSYKQTRNELMGADYSSKFSPWLAQGCLSPKYIYHEIKRFEGTYGANDSTYWLFFELMWRDFFRLMLKKHGDCIFTKGGTKKQPRTDLAENPNILKIWVEGRTGIPFIDANMKEIAQTGFMSNRGRQNVASFLINDLKISWQMGAEYFESTLIDYDPCSNYGNWNYLAGIGSDPRENRYFNIVAQAHRYDPEGNYVKKWLPELSDLPKDRIHKPEMLEQERAQSIGFTQGHSYPKPMIDTARWS